MVHPLQFWKKSLTTPQALLKPKVCIKTHPFPLPSFLHGLVGRRITMSSVYILRYDRKSYNKLFIPVESVFLFQLLFHWSCIPRCQPSNLSSKVQIYFTLLLHIKVKHTYQETLKGSRELEINARLGISSEVSLSS